MTRNGFARPGALQMTLSLILLAAGSVVPFILAARRPAHEWSMLLTDLPALSFSLLVFVVAIVYFAGFLRYCASKGYSPAIGFCLFLSNLPGFLVLLLLPDLVQAQSGQC